MLISRAPLPPELMTEPIPSLIFLLVGLFIAKLQNKTKQNTYTQKSHFSNMIYEVSVSKCMHHT